MFLPSFFFNSCKGICWKKGTACSLTYLLPCLVSLCVIFLCCLCSCSKLMICERMSLMVSSFCFHISWVVPSTVQFSLWLSHSTGWEKNSFRDENYVTNSNYFFVVHKKRWLPWYFVWKHWHIIWKQMKRRNKPISWGLFFKLV